MFDRATPKEWVAIFIKASNFEELAIAFEAAGFKKCHLCKRALPTAAERSEWSPEDVRYSVVRYLGSPIPKWPMDPHVVIPKTGEILESDITRYHTCIVTYYVNCFFVQLAAHQ